MPKTANRYRELLIRLYNWAMNQYGIRMPGDRNPAAKVERYRERPPEIVFQSMEEIDEQLGAGARWNSLHELTALHQFPVNYRMN
ncbi:hypothetical protein [Geobacter sp.]|uniref:hypothetical protein n=1 Tax=Geobacter sp. TaxID=46610 RepID=UPI0027BA5B41|nr:hypothetical protein [Geobacter sp.]